VNHTEQQISVALQAEGASLMAPRAKAKFNRFIRLADGDFDKAIKWTAASIRNDAEYEERCRDHGCGCD
jgi:hypothetical protein